MESIPTLALVHVREKIAAGDLLAARALLVKYSDDQPRDDHGRFGSTGEEDDQPQGSPIGDSYKRELNGMPKLDRTIDGYRKLAGYIEDRTGTTLNVSQLTKQEELSRGLSAYVALHDRFPMVAARDINDDQYVAGTQRPGIQAWTDGNHNIGLAQQYWRTGGRGSLHGTDDGFHPPGTSTPEGVVTHEFGHLVSSALQRSPSLRDYASRLDAITKNAASGYGRTSAEENFAEMFAAAYAPGSTADTSLTSLVFRDIVESALGVAK